MVKCGLSDPHFDFPDADASGLPELSELRNPLKSLVRQAIGERRYDKLRFLRQFWLRKYLPAYLRRRRQLRQGQPGQLEDLYVFLTNQCNARCQHCFYIEELGYVPGELRLADYERLAPTMPRLKLLTLTGGEAVLHPDFKEIALLLGHATQAERVTVISNGFKPEKLEAACQWLLDQRLPGLLDVLISLDGLEPTHNAIRGNPRAWEWANESLARLTRLQMRHAGRFDLGVTTIINDRNYSQLKATNEHLRMHYPYCRQGFEFVRGTHFSLWGLPADVKTDFNPAGVSLPPREAWDEILETLRRINRRGGIVNHAFHITSRFTVEMLKTGRRIVPCVSAGQNVGVLYPTGEIAMCEFSRPCANLKDFGMDFRAAWNSPQADALRARLGHCHCTHGCYLSKNIEYTWRGLTAMARDL